MRFVLMLSITIGLSAHARGLPSYYSNFVKEQLRNRDVKNAILKAILSRQISNGPSQRKHLSYLEARKMLFGVLHLREDGRGYYLKDVYCSKIFGKSSGVGKEKVPRHTEVNCEHTWPQSRFSSKYSKSLQKTDLHHLFPTDNTANSTRGNYILAEVDGKAVADCSESKIGTANGHTAFEPPREHKGNAARALFYFSTRYKIKISAIEEHFLKKWHRLDPVDSAERLRNDRIHTIQGNRNPFIDDPSLVGRIKNF